jgi:integrative and conjugative element protein (TIGR02256 family)
MTAEWIYRRRDGRRVVFPSATIEIIEKYRQEHEEACEAGGMLLGRIIAETGDVVVDELTQPAPDDSRTRFTFVRGKEFAQDLVNRAWAYSSGTRIYLGEWHSHPESRPTPSPHDLGNWRAVVRGARYEQDELLFVIVGIDEVAVWELRRRQWHPARLKEISEAQVPNGGSDRRR